MVPIEKNMINKKILKKDEVKWIDNYHKKVKKNLFRFMSSSEKKDLTKSCSPI